MFPKFPVKHSQHSAYSLKEIPMIKTLLIAAVALTFIAGCESPSTTQPSPAHYEPADGRNLGPGLQEYSHGDPTFPEGIDRGGGGGPR
jgi:hypothetical protein